MGPDDGVSRGSGRWVARAPSLELAAERLRAAARSNSGEVAEEAEVDVAAVAAVAAAAKVAARVTEVEKQK